MRKDWRDYTTLVALWVIEVGAGVSAWFARPDNHLFLATLLIFPPLIATGLGLDLLRFQRRLASTKTDAATAAETAALTQTQALDALRESMAASINATIVEIVAAQQAVVRAAHPDDILLRLTAAEDSAHTALTATAPELAKVGATAGQSG
jgi:hypothetical protein